MIQARQSWQAGHSRPGIVASRWYLLAVLTSVGTINWADRQVVPILFPAIRADLSLSDTELGVLGGLAFSLIFAITAPLFGYAADHFLRKRIIVFGLLLWSAATAAGGLATGFWSLFIARFLTGIGEASLYPCALSLIGERFQAHERGRAIGIYQACAAIGGGLGIGLGGGLVQALGWRPVLFIYGASGLLFVPLLLSLHEDRRERTRDTGAQARQVIVALARDRRLRWIWAIGALAIACGQGFAAWGPSYLVRDHDFAVAEAGAVFGIAGLVGGLVGGVAGGALADRRQRRRTGGELDVVSAAAAVSGVLLAVLLSSGRGATAAVSGMLATVTIYAIFPGLLSSMLAIVPAKHHGMAGAVNAVLLGGVGAATGPFVVGALSDRVHSLHLALFVPVLGLGLAAVLAMLGGGIVRGAAHAPSDAHSGAAPR